MARYIIVAQAYKFGTNTKEGSEKTHVVDTEVDNVSEFLKALRKYPQPEIMKVRMFFEDFWNVLPSAPSELVVVVSIGKVE